MAAWVRRFGPGRLLAVLVVVGVLLMGVLMWAVHENSDGARQPSGSAGPSDSAGPTPDPLDDPAAWSGPRGPLGLTWTKDGGAQVVIPEDAYISRWDPSERSYGKPEPIDAGVLEFAADDPTSAGKKSVVVYLTDGSGRIEDVAVVGVMRGWGHQLAVQWAMSKDGVEIVWDGQGHGGWSIARDGTQLARDARGYYFDVGLVDATRSYTIRYDGLAEAQSGGEKAAGEDGDGYTYGLEVPEYDKNLLGRRIDRIGAAPSPGVVSSQGLVEGGDPAVEVARFVEWNSFIGEDYVGSDVCGWGNDIAYYGGDDRGYVNVPARDGFTADGTPRSRISTRVGSSWDLSGDGKNLNVEIYDDWLYRGVGTSHAYDEDGTLLREANVGTRDITLEDAWSDEENAWRLVRVNAPNPLCRLLGMADAPAISYDYAYDADREGNVVVSAIFDKAPNTEVLWEKSTDTSDPATFVGGCLYRFRNRGFHYLAPSAPSEHMIRAFPSGDAPTTDCVVN